MVIVVVIVVVLVAAAGIAWLVRRNGGDDTHSVDGYRNTLDTLQGIRSRTPSSVRILGQSDDPPAEAEDRPGQAGATPPADPSRRPGPGRIPAHGGGQGLVFEDPATRPPMATPQAGGTSRRTQDRAISAMNHRPRRLAAPILVAVVVVVLLVVVVVIGAHDHDHHPKASTTTTSSPRSHTTTTAKGGSAGGHSTTTTKPPKATTTTTTTTTVPASFKAVTSTSTTGTYVPPAASYTVTLAATTGECWLTVKSSTGTTVFSQTLAAGQSKALTMSGASTIEIGAPSAVTVTLDQKPVVLPAGYQTPFLMTMQPSATTGAGTTTTTGPVAT